VRWLGRHWDVVSAWMAVVGLLTGWLFWPAPSGVRFTRAQYNRIRLEMTRAEVETILGMAPGYYGDSDAEYEGPVYEETDGDMGAAYEALAASGVTPDGPAQVDWSSDSGSVSVWLLNDRVCEQMYTAPESKVHRRLMEWIDWLSGSKEPRPVRSVPRPSK
jgi:hypothetical protein